MADPDAAAGLRNRIRRDGPITFADYQQAALDVFFGRGRGAGRSGLDFVTSPETGSLFGALIARGLDGVWADLGRPDPFLVVDAGGGRGRLLAEVLRARPSCAPALRGVLVERSAALRDEARALLDLEPAASALGPFAPDAVEHGPEPVPAAGPVLTAVVDLPDVSLPGVLLANELLDNLPVRVVERRRGGWDEVRVGIADDGHRFVEVLLPASPDLTAEADNVATGTRPADGQRLPVPTGARAWLLRAARLLARGELWIIDYADEVEHLLARGMSGNRAWIRTYRAHGRGTDPLDAPGSQDITTDLPLGWLRRTAARAGLAVRRDTTQAAWLRDLGLDALVAEGAERWAAGAATGDLAAAAGRSRTVEGAALTDPDGLGAHRVVVLAREAPGRAAGSPRVSR